MNEQLKDAVVTIAGYMGYQLKIGVGGWDEENKRHQMWESETDCFTSPKYHTSADAILPVWRKVGEEIDNSDELTKKDSYHTGFGVESHHLDVGRYILNGNYEAACIELAQIIKSINGKV